MSPPARVELDRCVVDGGVPAALEVLQDSVFDFAGDVGVGLLDFVFEDVAEAEALGDLGDVVGDHPGFVAVA